MIKLILPSIIAKDQIEINNIISKFGNHADWLQLDVMDGNFVPTHSLDFDFDLPRKDKKYEAHLMVADPEKWIEKNYHKADTILFHVELCENIEKTIELIKNKKKKAGLAINPKTPVEIIRPYLDDVDEVLVMTVEPGFYGAKFLPKTLEKVKLLRRLKPELDIEVDGGMNSETIGLAAKAGANFFICGSYLQKSEDVKAALRELSRKLIMQT